MRWIVEAFRRCFDYSGRARRMEYWSYALFSIVVLALLAFVEKLFGLHKDPLLGLAHISPFIPGLAVSVRRLHDSDRAGWWLMLPAAPFVFWVVALVGGFNFPALFPIVMVAILLAPLALLALMCVPGTMGPNRFGADPKGPDLADRFS